jgi:hypothetical protein
MFETNILLSSIIFSSIWMWYFIYWKKSWKLMPLVSWIILMIYPYFIENIYYSVMIWVVLLIIPYFIRIDF